MTSIAELTLEAQLDIARIEFVREWPVHPGRKFRADFLIPVRADSSDLPLLIEVEGGGWINGRHSRGGGMEADCEKSALAAIAGYRVMRVTPSQVNDGRALRWIIEATAKERAA